MQEHALTALLVQELIVEIDHGLAVQPPTADLLAGVAVFLAVPMHHRTELAAIVAESAAVGAFAPVEAEAPGIGVVPYMRGLDDDEVLAMMGVGTVTVDRDLAADPAVIEGKGAEMLGDQHDRIALALVGAERPRRHHAAALEPQRAAEIVEPRHEQAVAHRISADPQILDRPLHDVRGLLLRGPSPLGSPDPWSKSVFRRGC